MKHYFLFILLSAAIATGGCTEELQPQTCGTNGTVPDESELTEAVLNLSVNAFVVEAQAETRASIPSGTPEKETPEEKEIHNIWVFQYDAATKELLIKPRYYTITDQAMLQDLPVYLKAGVLGQRRHGCFLAKIQAAGATEKANPAHSFPVTVDRQGVDTNGRSQRRGGGDDRYYGHSTRYAYVCQTQSKGRDAKGGDGTE